MSAIDRIKETITEALMNSRGWDELSKEKNPIEWNPEVEDSQYSLLKEDVDFIVNEFMEQIGKIEESFEEDYGFEDDEEVSEPQSIFDEYGHIRREQTNTTSATVFVFMDAGTGNPPYVSDVREWLARVDRLGVPNDTEIEGTLHLSFDIDEPYTERIECGGCGTKDILLTVHSCEETPC
jgi:hypothetical protein